jgi:Type II secretion system (T2SS), protein G
MQLHALARTYAAGIKPIVCSILAIICACFGYLFPRPLDAAFAVFSASLLTVLGIYISSRASGRPKIAGLTLNVGAVAFILFVFAAEVVPRFEVDAKLSRATMDIKNLTIAVQFYKTRNGDFPITLEWLVNDAPNGTVGYVERKLLTDPWGNNYEYYPDKLHPQTHMPLIRSQGAPGSEPMPLTNWPPD